MKNLGYTLATSILCTSHLFYTKASSECKSYHVCLILIFYEAIHVIVQEEPKSKNVLIFTVKAKAREQRPRRAQVPSKISILYITTSIMLGDW